MTEPQAVLTNVATRFLNQEDAPALTELYRTIAAGPNGFVRMEDEITPEFVDKSLKRGLAGGIGICAIERQTGKLVASILARKMAIKVFDHVLTGLIIGVQPEYQSHGIGRRLLFDFLEHVQMERPDILRVELIARESNQRQIAFYESVGFRREGHFERRLRTPSGEFESDIAMAWLKRDERIQND